MTVIDLGCQPQRIDRSIEPLVERFQPETLLGFDPAATPPFEFAVGDTEVVIEKTAAWVQDGTVEFSAPTGIEGTVMRDSNVWDGLVQSVPCFDFSSWLHLLNSGETVVKMDIEGAEVPVLEKLIADGNDQLISLLLVEWHDRSFDHLFTLRRAKIEQLIRCPVEVWH